MTMFLSPGYEDAVRARLAVKRTELSDDVINQPSILLVSEATVLRRVPGYETMTDATDRLLLESAIIAYIGYKLCPTMANRIKVDVATLDVKWKKAKVDWEDLANRLLAESEQLLADISVLSYQPTLLKVAKRDGVN